MRIPTLLVLACCCALSPFADPETATGTLKLSVTDEAGQPLPFRGYIQNEAEMTFMPPRVVTFVKRSTHDEWHFIAQGRTQLDLPDGRYRIRIERGLEWIPVDRWVDVAAEPVEIAVTLQRWVDMNAKGWYSGDLHLHRQPQEALWAVAAEGLNFAANQTHWNQKNAYEEHRLPEPQAAYFSPSSGHAVNVRAQELERLGDGWGAVLFLGDFEPLALPEDHYYPLMTTVAAQARTLGAHVDFEKPVWREVPVAAALGLADSIGIVHNHFHPHAFLPMNIIDKAIVPPARLDLSPREGALYTLQLYYHLLNSGLRIAASAGSASGVMPSWPGFARVYVQLDTPFSPDAWLDALKAGRSFATNGPLIFLRVEEHGPGAVVELPGPTGRFRVRAEAQTRLPRLAALELVHNGRVILRSDAERGADLLRIEQELELGPGWIHARCFEQEGPADYFALTSPVYLEHEGNRGVVPESARYYADFVQSLMDQAREDKRFGTPEQEASAMEVLEKARNFYVTAAGAGE